MQDYLLRNLALNCQIQLAGNLHLVTWEFMDRICLAFVHCKYSCCKRRHSKFLLQKRSDDNTTNNPSSEESSHKGCNKFWYQNGAWLVLLYFYFFFSRLSKLLKLRKKTSTAKLTKALQEFTFGKITYLHHSTAQRSSEMTNIISLKTSHIDTSTSHTFISL